MVISRSGCVAIHDASRVTLRRSESHVVERASCLTMHRHQLRRNAQLEFHTPVGHRLCVAMAIAVMACTGADRSRAPSGGNAASVGQPTIGQRAGPHPIPALVPHPLPPVSPHPVVWSEASLAAALTSASRFVAG